MEEDMSQKEINPDLALYRKIPEESPKTKGQEIIEMMEEIGQSGAVINTGKKWEDLTKNFKPGSRFFEQVGTSDIDFTQNKLPPRAGFVTPNITPNIAPKHEPVFILEPRIPKPEILEYKHEVVVDESIREILREMLKNNFNYN